MVRSGRMGTTFADSVRAACTIAMTSAVVTGFGDDCASLTHLWTAWRDTPRRSAISVG